MRGWKNKSLGLIGIFIFLLVIRFFPIIFQGRTVVWGDNYSLMIPGKIFIAQNLKEGRLPLWNPYIFSGVPLIHDINQSVLYFTSLIFVLFKPAVATNLSVITHVILMSLGTYRLISHLYKDKRAALLGAALMAFSTQVSGSINNLSTLQSVTWFPWIALLGIQVHRGNKQIFLYGLLVLLQFLAGYPQHVIYAIGFSVLLSFSLHYQKLGIKKLLKVWLLTGFWTVIISTMVWLPFTEMLLDSTRMEQSLEQAQVGSLKPEVLIKMIFPYFFDKQNEGIKWGPSWSGQPNVLFYLGNFCLLLLLSNLAIWRKWRKEEWFYFGFVVISIVFAFGENLPGFELVQKAIPLFKFSRGPSMILVLTNLVLVVWAAAAFSKVKLQLPAIKIASFIWIFWILLGLLLLYLVDHNFTHWWTQFDQLADGRLSTSIFHTLPRDRAITTMIATNLVTAGLFALLSLWAFQKKFKTLVVVFVGLDIVVHTQGMFFFAPKETYQYLNNRVFQNPLKANPQYRTITRNSNMSYTDYGTYWEAMVARGAFGDNFVNDQELQTYSKLINIRDSFSPNWNIVYQIPMVHGYATLLPKDYAAIWRTSDQARINFIDFIDLNNSRLSDWSVKYYIVDRLFEIKEELPFPKLEEQGQFTLFELAGAKPRFRFSDDRAVELQNFVETPNQISFNFSNSGNQQELIIANRFDRNWRARLNGRAVMIDNLNGMQKIPIDSGENELKLWFEPRLFYYGFAISFVALVGGLIGLNRRKISLISKRFV